VQENLGGVLGVLGGDEVVEAVAIEVGDDGCGVFPGGGRESFEQGSGVRKVPSPLPGKMRNVFPSSVAMTSGIPSPSTSPTATVYR
jgi:hypothetical protein